MSGAPDYPHCRASVDHLLKIVTEPLHARDANVKLLRHNYAQHMRPTLIVKQLLEHFSRTGSQGVFLGNLLIGGSVALFVYFIEQTGIVGFTLRQILYLLLLSFEAVFRYTQGNTLTFSGMAIDLAIIAAAALLWTYLKSVPARMLGNLLLLLALIPGSILLFNRTGILIRGVPILTGILLAIIFDAARDRLRNRLRQRIAEEKQEAEYSVIRHLAHNVKPNLQIARSPLLSLRDLMAQHNFTDVELSRRLDGTRETVGEALDQAVAGLNQISEIIDNTRKLVTREISPVDFREIELTEVLERDLFPLHKGVFKCIVTGGPVRLRLHRESFVEAMHNLLRNASVHGFAAQAIPDATVSFAIRQTRKQVIIDYSNNGRPFPANLSPEDFLSFGKKSVDSPGEGLGGAWIGKVIEAHDGTFAIIRDELPVHFRITLPKRGR